MFSFIKVTKPDNITMGLRCANISLNVSPSLVKGLYRSRQHLKFCFIKVSQKVQSAFLLNFKQSELLNSSVEVTIKGSN